MVNISIQQWFSLCIFYLKKNLVSILTNSNKLHTNRIDWKCLSIKFKAHNRVHESNILHELRHPKFRFQINTLISCAVGSFLYDLKLRIGRPLNHQLNLLEIIFEDDFTECK